MITDTGKAILAKYLIGQTPSYASHIAIGCGAKPASLADPDGDFSEKTSLDFEMLRVPIISRGYVNTNNQPEIVLTAELPTVDRYEITEIGIFPSANNSIAGSTDSKNLYTFVSGEDWQHHRIDDTAITIPTVTGTLDDGNNTVTVQYPVFQTNSDNKTFTYLDRVKRYENCRFLNNIIAIRGDDANIGFLSISNATLLNNVVTYTTLDTHPFSVGDSVNISGFASVDVAGQTVNFNGVGLSVTSTPSPYTFTVSKTAPNATSASNDFGLVEARDNFYVDVRSNHIHLTNTRLNLNDNANDELRLAFSVMNRVGLKETDTQEFATAPLKVRILVEFKSTEGNVVDSSIQNANFEIELVDGENGVNFNTNRYYVRSVSLDDLKKSINFSWSSIDVIKISATVVATNSDGVGPSSDFYVLLDALRLENTTARNPLYGLVGYTVAKTPNAETILKPSNTANYIEFRFGFG